MSFSRHVLFASVVFVAAGAAVAPVVWEGLPAGASSADISQLCTRGELLAEPHRVSRRPVGLSQTGVA